MARPAASRAVIGRAAEDRDRAEGTMPGEPESIAMALRSRLILVGRSARDGSLTTMVVIARHGQQLGTGPLEGLRDGHDSVVQRIAAIDVPTRVDDRRVAPGVDPRPRPTGTGRWPTA